MVREDITALLSILAGMHLSILLYTYEYTYMISAAFFFLVSAFNQVENVPFYSSFADSFYHKCQILFGKDKEWSVPKSLWRECSFANSWFTPTYTDFRLLASRNVRE